MLPTSNSAQLSNCLLAHSSNSSMGTKSLSGSMPTSPEPPRYTRPTMPPPPYFKTHDHLSSFKTAVNTKIDNPIICLSRLSFRLLQFAFALASGISYAIELSRGHIHESAFIYTQVVFGFTLLTLVVDSIMVRYYRSTWIVEWILVVLWFVCFAVFYQAYLVGAIEQDFLGTDVDKMRRAVWYDLVNALLWVGSAIFSSAMCCAGTKAAIKASLDGRRQRKDRKAATTTTTTTTEFGGMESGTIGPSST
jgi:hypothetical protein